MIPESNRDERLTNTYIGQPLIVAAYDGVATLESWLMNKCSDTVEQSVIPGDSNDERLTNVDKRNCYIYAS